MAEPWNINIHYDCKLDNCVPPRAASVLDVGCGDGFLAAGADLGSFDAVVSNAALHHFPDTRVALQRMRERVLPGGTLALVTFARPGWRHLPWALATLVTRGVAIRLRGKWEHSAPTVWPPRDTVAQLRGHVRAELPGARVSLLPLGRVFIWWHAPAL